MKGFLDYVKRNPMLGIGIACLVLLLGFTLIGRLFIDRNLAYKMTTERNIAPGEKYPFGTDAQGRNLLAIMVYGSGMTLEIGAIAGLIGLGTGILLGFVSGYFGGGMLDMIITGIVDIFLTIPGFLILILVATTFKNITLTPPTMGLVVGLVSWAGPARSIRAQVLSMRERPFVMMAKLSGMSTFEIILKELVPNLAPFLVMSLSQSVYGGIGASLGLEALGLGNRQNPTMGMTLFFVQYYSAFLLGTWWWIIEPVAVIVLTLVSLVLMSFGLDELANPRARRSV